MCLLLMHVYYGYEPDINVYWVSILGANPES